jgi:thiosulfate dehydrogenase (quinone) large subunit
VGLEAGADRKLRAAPAKEAIMTIIRTPRHHSDHVPRQRAEVDGAAVSPVEGPAARMMRYVAAGLRLSIGWVFVWAFLDKAFGLGHDTAGKDAWIHGGSPTKGFLGFATSGPFAGVYHQIAGQGWVDWLFMFGLLGIGVALMAGVAMRLAAACGVVLLVLMWSAVLPPANNPFMDDHLIYALVLVLLAAAGAGHTLGLGRVWERVPVVMRNGWLR